MIKLNVTGFIDGIYHSNKAVEVVYSQLHGISNVRALYIVSQQCLYPSFTWVDANNYVLFFTRNDLSTFSKPTLADASMSVSAVCSDNFRFFTVDKEYLLDVLGEIK